MNLRMVLNISTSLCCRNIEIDSLDFNNYLVFEQSYLEINQEFFKTLEETQDKIYILLQIVSPTLSKILSDTNLVISKSLELIIKSEIVTYLSKYNYSEIYTDSVLILESIKSISRSKISEIQLLNKLFNGNEKRQKPITNIFRLIFRQPKYTINYQRVELLRSSSNLLLSICNHLAISEFLFSKNDFSKLLENFFLILQKYYLVKESLKELNSLPIICRSY
ncbi:hypothetical protein CWI39_1480p0010 [Hamiltosporidium magnivora]|uniref:Uncharacterized protein n=1 Tax=Hamiltosporidium magnivora TaxID=148818 RepID=A0A4Q9L183_9MICR|nr:hypothetical protein CWI39_1480p0010 [Hamiltosporidium magnivora]